jgi:peptidoglycan/LPS O-acetylase OafA/YrhL
MQYPLIDVLRAIAALLVMVVHVTALGQWTRFAEPVWGLPFRNGWIGVDLFLVISGFVITLSAAREHNENPLCFKRSFMKRRLRRLVPLYALTCVVYVLLVRPELLTYPTVDIARIVLSYVFFVQNMSPSTHDVINGPTWSLALEMQFYVALVLSVGSLVRLGPGRAWWLLIAIAWGWRYASTWVLVPGQGGTELQSIYTTQLPGVLDTFGMGIALALVVQSKQGRLARSLQMAWPHFFGWLAASGALLVLVGALLLNWPDYWSHTGMIVFWRTLLAMGFAAGLAAAIACPLRGGGLLWPVRYLGQISYGIYLWHIPVLLSLLTLPALRGGKLFMVLLAGTVLLAALSWHLMERKWISSQR